MRFSRLFLQRLERIPFHPQGKRRGEYGNDGGIWRSTENFCGIEFEEHLPYLPGDDPRYVDWKLYSRLETLQIKKFAGEKSLNVTIFLDISRSMAAGSPAKFERYLKIAVGLALIFLKMKDSVSLVFADHRIRKVLPARSGKISFGRIVRFLESAEPNGSKTDFAAAVKEIPLWKIPAGPIWILSDFYDKNGFRSGLEFLLWKKFHPSLIFIHRSSDSNFLYRGNAELVDAETGAQKRLFVDRLQAENYQKRFDAFLDYLRNTSSELGIPFYEAEPEIETELFLTKLMKEMKQL